MATAPIPDPTERVMMAANEILRLLETVPMLAEMATRERAALAEVAEVVRCARDVQLFGVGQEVRWWYLVLNGQVQECVRAPDGSWQPVREVAAGNCFGLDAVLSNSPAATQATTLSASSFVRVNAGALQNLLRGSGAASVKLTVALNESLGQDLRAATITLAELVG